MKEKKIRWNQRWKNLELVSDKRFTNIPKLEPNPINNSEVFSQVYFYPLEFYPQSKKDIKRAVKEFQEAVKNACAFANIGKEGNQQKCPIVFVKSGGKEEFWNGSIRSIDFIKSSIWNYFWDPNCENAEKEIERILCDIQKNFEENRYVLSAAEEYAEFNSRMCLNSYLKYDDHSAAVSPFLFHSEYKMKSLLYEKDEKENLSKNLNWRFLLVDDHPDCKDPMMAPDGITVGKLDVIKDDLKRIGISNIQDSSNTNHNNQTSNFVEFDFAKTIDDAFEKIKKYKYDIILLDYKLSKIGEKQEYGYELLEKIRGDQEGKNNQGGTRLLNPGPNDTYYFMFISAYTTAVQERLQKGGFYLSKDYWFIGRGACPTNTPYLFLYCLKRMMDIRYDKLTKHSKQLLKDLNKQKGTLTDKDIETEKGKYATMTMFLTKLYEKDNERNNCVIGFNAFLNLRRVYDTIKHDVDHSSKKEEERRMKSSPLILSLFKDEEFCSNSFWEHLQDLVYLTAFGTIRQWPEMWEDYIFIKGKLEKAESEYESYWAVDKYTKPSILIRDYILSLKGMMS